LKEGSSVMNLDDYKDLFLDGKKNQIPITGICAEY